MKTDTNHVLKRFSNSQIFQDYQRAFSEATGLPLTLASADDWHLAQREGQQEDSFWGLLSKHTAAGAAWMQTQHDPMSTAGDQPHTVTCFAGLRETAVPVRVGEQLIGFLRTGGVLSRQPTTRDFSRVARRVKQMGIKMDMEKLREAYFQSRVFPSKQYESMLQLLRIFAQHLSMVANQVAFQNKDGEPLNISRAREFIRANQRENLSLAVVAREAHMSAFYFCKQFKKATGLNFTDYLNRVRNETARQELLRPNARVSEVAFEVGFTSLTHFNRVFKKLNGESPTTYRTHLPLACAA